MKISFKTLLLPAFVLVAFASCDKEDDVSDKGWYEFDGKDYTVHNFVYQTFGSYYYWYENVPDRLDLTRFEYPEDVLESFRESTDRFSAVLNNYTETENWFNNDYKTDGLTYALHRDGENGIVAVVNYVYDNSPAQKAGLKRGDVITKINSEPLTRSNYSALLNADVCTYTYKKIAVKDSDEGQPSLDWKNSDEETTESVTKTDMKIDPVLQVKTFNKDGKVIGYMLYDSFTQETAPIISAVEKLQAAQVTDLVLDLRLNGGGYVSTLDTLASMLVPEGNEGRLFIRTEFNPLLSRYLARENPDYNKTYFVPISPKLSLSTLYVLISSSTASASEELISGLSPYMKVVLIGNENSYGKFTSNVLLNDENDNGCDKDGIPYSEWAAYVSIGCCKNSADEMKFSGGFTPDYKVKEVYHELGDENEPFLSTAISLITGKAISKRAKQTDLPIGEFFGVFGKPEITRSAMISKINLKKR